MLRLHHVDLGGAGKPPMIVLHGLLGSSRNWQTTGRDLAEQFHVLALDARNHGKSPHAEEMSYATMTADLIGWMDSNAIPQATIVGHSMGGKTAMLAACRHPDRFERMVIVDVAPKTYHWIAHRGEFTAMHELNLPELASRQEAEMRFEARVPDLGMRKFLTTNLARDETGRWSWTINLPALTGALPAMEQNPLGENDRYDRPVLVIAGGKSRYVQAEDHEAIRKHFPHAKIETIPESGHNPHMETRAEFVRLMRAFCTGGPADDAETDRGRRPATRERGFGDQD